MATTSCNGNVPVVTVAERCTPIQTSALQAVLPEPSASKTLFEKLGGDAAIDAVVEAFFAKLLANSETAKFFQGKNLISHKHSVGRFLKSAFGGPVVYHGPDMAAAHSRARANGLCMKHFLQSATALEEVMTEVGVPQDLQDEVLAAFNGLAKPICYGITA